MAQNLIKQTNQKFDPARLTAKVGAVTEQRAGICFQAYQAQEGLGETRQPNVGAGLPSQGCFSEDPTHRKSFWQVNQALGALPTKPGDVSLGCVVEIRQKCSQRSTFQKAESLCIPPPSREATHPAHQSLLSLVPGPGKEMQQARQSLKL